MTLDFGYDWDRQGRSWHRCTKAGRRLSAAENRQVDSEWAERVELAKANLARRRRNGLPI